MGYAIRKLLCKIGIHKFYMEDIHQYWWARYKCKHCGKIIVIED